jgi:hypothetical protein
MGGGCLSIKIAGSASIVEKICKIYPNKARRTPYQGDEFQKLIKILVNKC